MSVVQIAENEAFSRSIVCSDCGRPQMRRLPRSGFLQHWFWPRLGYFPWECPICRKMKLIRYRGKRGPRK